MPTGTMSTYNLTVGVQLDIEDIIHLLSPFDVPLLGTQGADGRSTLSTDTCFEKKVEWLDEELLTPRSTLAATTTTGQTTIVVASGERLKFQTDDIVRIDDEILRITGYNASADTLDVVRGYGGTTAAQHATNAAVVGVGSAGVEGSDPPAARFVDRANRYNVTEIFGPVKISVTGTEQVVRKYGIPTTEFDHQVTNRSRELYVAIEQALLYGVRVEDDANNRRAMGGMSYYITTNVDSTTTQITETKLLDQLQACYDKGGNPDRIVVGSAQKRQLSGINSANIRYTQADSTRGQVVDFYDSDFGRISILLNRWVRRSDIFGFSRDQATVCVLRPLTMEMLAKTGDSVHGMILCEKTLRFRRERHAFRFTALT